MYMSYVLLFRCINYVQATELDLKRYNIQGIIHRLDCKKCNQFVAIKVNDDILDLDNSFNDKYENNWCEVIFINNILINVVRYM